MDSCVDIYAQQLNTDNLHAVNELSSIYGSNVRLKPGREAKCCSFSKCKTKFVWSTGRGIKTIQTDTVFKKWTNDHLIDCGMEVKAMEFAPYYNLPNMIGESTNLLAVGLREGGIKIYNVHTGSLVFNLSDHQKDISGLSFASCKWPILISSSLDKTLKVWDLEDDGNMTLTLVKHNFPVCDCAFSPTDKHVIASVGMGKEVIIWNLFNKREYGVLCKLRGHKNDVVSCSWSPDGAVLATASHDSTVMIWDPFLGEAIARLCHQYPMPCPIYAGGANGSWVSSVSFSNNGMKIATVCEDNRLRMWSPWSGDDRNYETVLSQRGFQCCFSADDQFIAVGKENGSVTVVAELSKEVLPLTSFCRIALRKVVSSFVVLNSHLPQQVKDFLLYRSSLD